MTLSDTYGIKKILTSRRNVVVAFCDTNGFSTFTRRTVDQPQRHRDYLLALYRRSHEYRKKFKCFMKTQCDGAIFVHDFEEDPTAQQVIDILKGVEQYQKDCHALTLAVPYPRPDGFRCRVTMGQAWMMEVVRERPQNCAINDCGAPIERDYWDHATILASRMLDSHKKVPNACCQLVKETAMSAGGIIFEKLPTERRLPDGVFREDMQDLWSFGSKPIGHG